MTWVKAEIIGGPKDGETIEIPSHWDAIVIDADGDAIRSTMPPIDGAWYRQVTYNNAPVLIYTDDYS